MENPLGRTSHERKLRVVTSLATLVVVAVGFLFLHSWLAKAIFDFDISSLDSRSFGNQVQRAKAGLMLTAIAIFAAILLVQFILIRVLLPETSSETNDPD